MLKRVGICDNLFVQQSTRQCLYVQLHQVDNQRLIFIPVVDDSTVNTQKMDGIKHEQVKIEAPCR